MAALIGIVMLFIAMVALAAFAGREGLRFAREASQRPADGVPAGWHRLLGYAFVAAGVLIWTVLGGWVAPVARGVFAGELALDEEDRTHELEAERLVTFGREARWAAILLAVGGLVLLARAAHRRLAVTGIVVVWVVADLVLDLADAAQPTILLAGLAVACLTALATLGRGRGAAGAFPLVYSGASVTASFPLVMAVGPWSAEQLAPWAVPLVAVEASLLVLAGVAVAVAASPSLSPRRAWYAGVVALAGAAAAAAHTWWEFGAGDEEADGGAFLPGVAAVALILSAGAIVCGAGVRSARDRWLWLGVTVGLGIVTGLAIGFAFGVVTFAQFVVPGAGVLRLFVEGPLYVVPGIVAGALVGLVTLLPVTWSWRRRVEPEPAPEEEQPPEPRPVAVPGVPEILEWPPRPDGDEAVAAEPADAVIDLGELAAKD